MRLQFGTQKVRREWKETAEYTEADYKVIQVDNEVNILQLTDIHYDASNNRKEDTVKLIKQVIENSGADMIALTGDWCYYTPVGKKEKCEEIFDINDSYGIPRAPIFGNHDAEIFLSKYESIKQSQIDLRDFLNIIYKLIILYNLYNLHKA